MTTLERAHHFSQQRDRRRHEQSRKVRSLCGFGREALQARPFLVVHQVDWGCAASHQKKKGKKEKKKSRERPIKKRNEKREGLVTKLYQTSIRLFGSDSCTRTVHRALTGAVTWRPAPFELIGRWNSMYKLQRSQE